MQINIKGINIDEIVNKNLAAVDNMINITNITTSYLKAVEMLRWNTIMNYIMKCRVTKGGIN